MKIWLDTEFYENGRTIDLISIGLAREDGATYYAETEVAQTLAKSSDWLKANVLPYLNPINEKPRAMIASDIVDFAGEKPEFWAYYADYDWVVMCQLYGTMMQLPKGWPMYCRDVKQLCDQIGNPQLPAQTSTEHHALADAEWTKEAHEYLERMYLARHQ